MSPISSNPHMSFIALRHSPDAKKELGLQPEFPRTEDGSSLAAELSHSISMEIEHISSRAKSFEKKEDLEEENASPVDILQG